MNRKIGNRIYSRGHSKFRALTSFKSLEPKHKTFLVKDDASDPHLRKGEYAVVDITDNDPQHGELYVIQYESGERRREIVQVRSAQLNITSPTAEPSLVWWVGDLRGYRKANEVAFGDIPVFAGLSDGPYQTEYLQSKLLGRVVGVAFTHLGGLIASSAGWLNEATGNAAFDPVEYINTLLATGHKPAVYCDERGEPRWYGEAMPRRRQTKGTPQLSADLCRGPASGLVRCWTAAWSPPALSLARREPSSSAARTGATPRSSRSSSPPH